MLSKVKSVQGAGDFDMEINGNTVKLYSFEYEMEDGTILKANHKTNTSPFPTGSEVDYNVTKTHPEYGNSGTVKKPDSSNYSQSNGSKGGVGANRSFALSYAKDVLVASYMTQNQEVLVLSTEQMFGLAEKMHQWLEDKKEEPKPTTEEKQEGLQTEKHPDDDLPF